ncbi:hypothetical protein HRD49_40395 [Corallococcus exiguus]|uniref:hypothetical protein n=1 Tax=Corallococcus exiguus TaxID=83462 RepID=UPI0015608495|nr:hypothetical protein [Corallococcus exiguus]NRD68008.1 hypothetical protein [Corallococcus exiguus]
MQDKLNINTTAIVALSLLLASTAAHAQNPPNTISLGSRLNVALIGGYIQTTARGLDKPEDATIGFTAETSLFTLANCKACPDEIGAGIAFQTTANRVQIQDLGWLSAYWLAPFDDRAYFGIQAGLTKFWATIDSGSTTIKDPVLKAEGFRGALAIGWQFGTRAYIELDLAGRIFPAPEAVDRPLRSSPFGSNSATLSVGFTLGETLKEANERKRKSQVPAPQSKTTSTTTTTTTTTTTEEKTP